jgi:hypothetical protein
VRDKEEGGKHHCVIPVVDTAVRTTLVLEEPVTDRTEEEDTYNIAHTVRKGDEYKYSRIKYAREVEDSEQKIQSYPAECKDYERLVGGKARFFLACGYVVSLELLLTTYGFELRGEDTEYHTREEEYPHNAPEDGVRISFSKGERSALDLAYYIINQGYEKQHNSEGKLKIVIYV